MARRQFKLAKGCEESDPSNSFKRERGQADALYTVATENVFAYYPIAAYALQGTSSLKP